MPIIVRCQISWAYAEKMPATSLSICLDDLSSFDRGVTLKQTAHSFK